MSLLQSRGVEFKSLTENMDTTTPGGVLIFNVFAAMAQFERDLIRERTNAGLQAARARGHRGGRPSKLNAKQRERIRELYQGRTLTVQEIANQYHVSRKTIYNAIRE
jgi:DNA invertase Pin-like site-specific DNA recombinase